MKRVLSFLLLGLVWGNARVSFAQESAENELELVRQLRNKGWNDLAKAKIEELAKSQNPILVAALPLELARLNVSVARQQDPEQRFALFAAARRQLEDFIRKNQGKPQAALASAELARVTTYHGQTLLSKAMREEDNAGKHERARPAEAMFIQAGKDLDAAEKALTQALQNPPSPGVKTLLQEELQQTRLDRATNLFDQARTYIDKQKDVINAKRSEIMAAAKKAFTEMSKDSSTQISTLATAWLMKCAMELDAPDEVNAAHDAVMRRKGEPGASNAVRLVRYFEIQDVTPGRRDDLEAIGRNPKYAKLKPLDRLKRVEEKGESWLKSYPGALKTYEGQGVLYELAIAHLTEAEMHPKDLKLQGIEFDKALKVLDVLAEMDSDLSERARQLSMSIKFRRLDVKAELKTFEECIMGAMIQREKVREINGKMEQPKLESDKTKLEEDRKKYLKEVIRLLGKSMSMVTSKTAVQKVDEARYFLAGAYLAYGDPYRAAIVAESLARNKPPTRRSPEGASTAIQTYSSLQNRKPDDQILRKRLEDLANYVLSEEMQRTWKDDPVSSLAHYHLGLSFIREKETKKAIAHLEQIAPSFMDYIYTQGQIVFMSQGALEQVTDKNVKSFYVDKAKQAIARMTNFNPKAESPSVIAMYFYAKMEGAKFAYSEAIEDLNAREELKAVKKCTEMASYVRALMSEFEKVPLLRNEEVSEQGKMSRKTHEQIEFSMQVMLKYADLGIAEVKFRGDAADRFDQVIAATKNVVDQMLAKAKATPANEPIRLRDYRVTGDILGLALRANVQKGDVVAGKTILDVIKRLNNENGTASSNVVSLLLNDISTQIKILIKTKDKSLEKTKGNYTAFLDEIAKEYDAKSWDNNAAIMIGHAFVSLDFPSKAAKAYGKVKAPANLDKVVLNAKPPKGETDKQAEERQKLEEEARQYWGVQVEYVRMLRLCKDDADSLKTAEKAVAVILAAPNASFKAQAMMEKNLIVEEQGDKEVAALVAKKTKGESSKYREAYVAWSKGFLSMPSLKDKSNKDVAKIYFSGYFYSARTLFKMAMYDPKIKDRDKFITGAAKMFVNLEYAAEPREGWKIVEPMFQELMKQEPRLKEEYDKEKAKRLKAAFLSPPAGAAVLTQAEAQIHSLRHESARLIGMRRNLRVFSAAC